MPPEEEDSGAERPHDRRGRRGERGERHGRRGEERAPREARPDRGPASAAPSRGDTAPNVRRRTASRRTRSNPTIAASSPAGIASSYSISQEV